ncbi:thiol-disulfide isomerase/thioredoxin [Algoriphagus sp. 4150]|uniref:TlpA family protein disulfide reductase n=1 Tax=Algoriphagus sp. 4150 TaxID=2817756 RepID=UPI0028674A12|nr:hypothetical protein [Algoriphagus sp. 4150]MDR7128100.1 thiol-disulfide isomerase/thioredoxin [Algoriphagus sp. 4150]
MKKTLLICLLGLLCLPTSTTTAQVADSPGADFLHRSVPQVSPDPGDSHRGGAIRPDTLPEQNGLVDHSGQGQKSAGSSASGVGFFTLKGEISAHPSDTLDLVYELVQRELDPYYGLMDIQKDSISLQKGSFYAGTSRKQTFLLRLPINEPFARFNLYAKDVPLLQNIWVQPGDSLIVHWNLSKQQLHFSGPAAAHVRVQRQLKEIALGESEGRNPVMIIPNAAVMLNTQEKKTEYNAVLESYVPAWNRKLELLETETMRIERAENLFSSRISHPVFVELERYSDVLKAPLHQWLKIYWTGVFQNSALKFVKACRPKNHDWAEVILGHGLDVSGLLPEDLSGILPFEFAESLLMENILLESLTPVSFLHLTASIPGPLRDQVNSLYLIREHKDLPNADSLFSRVLSESRVLWIGAQLEVIRKSVLKGSDFSPHGFIGTSGNRVFPEEWKGKIVLIDYWLSGCGACQDFAENTFLPLMREFETQEDLLFVTISGDRNEERWKKSLASGKYTTPQSINLYSGGSSHPSLRQTFIRAFPAQMLLDREGKILQAGEFPKNLEGWIRLIQSYLPKESSLKTVGESNKTLSVSTTDTLLK